MAKLHFFYSTMNAGKSTALLQTNHNFQENNFKTLVFIPEEVANYSKGNVVSRIGIKTKAIVADKDFDYYEYIKNDKDNLKTVLVDESQFLLKKQVHQLALVADDLNIPVICYGLRTDFMGKLFKGSKELLTIADNIFELKTICTLCTKKATMVVRLDENKKVLTQGEKIRIGGNETYQSVCRKHFRELTGLL
jgi:thymidine kinase